MAERERGDADEVDLRASKDGNSATWRISRASAEERAADLRADGWEVEIVEAEPEGQ